MKSNKSSFKSFRKKVVSKEGVDAISPGIRHGETLIPKGSSIATIELPETKETFTYEIINSDAMTGDIKIAATEGSLKGLILNSTAGTLSVTPMPANCKQVLFETSIKDGSYIETLSDGSDWFLWSFGIGNGLGVSTNTYVRGNVGLIGFGDGTVFNPIILGPTYEPVSITSSVVTVEYPGGVATHDISFRGTAEPGSTLKIFDISNTLIGTVNPVANDGSWSFTASGLTNGPHQYTFKAFVGGSFINQSAVWSDLLDGGSINFSCSQIQVEVGTTNPNFATEPVVYHEDSNGVRTAITNTTEFSTTYSDASAADTTFDVVFEFTYDSVTYQRTVTGNIIVNLVQPAIPTIDTVDGNASGIPISVTVANISGTALPNADVIVWVNRENTSTPATADATGQWTIPSYDFGFTTNQSIVLYAQQQTVNGTLWSNISTQFNVVYEQNVLDEPAVTNIAGLSSGGFTNNSGPLIINGTGVIGATVTLASAGSALTTTPSTITVDSNGDWTASLPNLSDETSHTITAQQSKTGFTQSQQSTGFVINVDRTPPVLAAVSDTVLYLPNTTDTLPTATDAFSSVVVTAAYSPALTNTEDDYVATYTATDQAGNTTTDNRTITVTSPVIVPTNLVATDNGNGTATVEGDVTGTYADNLTVQVLVRGLDDGSPVEVSNGSFSYTTTNLGNGTFEITAITINSAGEESGLSNEETLLITASATQFLEDSSSLVIDSTHSSDVYYHTDGTLIHNVSSALTNGAVASIPVSLMSNTYTPDSITYSIWFYLDPSSDTQVRILKGTSGGSPNHSSANGPGIVWQYNNGVPYLKETTSGITDGSSQNNHSDGTLASRYYPPTGSNLARSAWHHVMVQHEWDSANTRWLTNVFINGGRATDAVGNEVSNVHIDSGNVSQSILNTTKLNYLASSRGTQIDSYDVAIDSSATITAAIAEAIYNDSTRQTNVLDAIESSAGPFLEERAAATTNLSDTNRVEIVNGVFSRTVSANAATYINLSDEGILSYTNSVRDHIALTLSFWFKPNEEFTSATKILGFYDGNKSENFGIRMGKDPNGPNVKMSPIIGSLWTNFQSDVNLTPIFNVDQWYHGAVVMTDNGNNTGDVKLFVDGVLVGTELNKTFTLLDNEDYANFGIGTATYGATSQILQISSNRLSLDSIQIADNVALSDSQVTAIYNQIDRQMTIAEAAAIPNVSSAFIEDNSGALTVTADADLFDDSGNTIFRNFPPPSATTAGCAQGDWSDYVTYNGGSFSYTSMTISLWLNPKEHFTSNTATAMRLFSSREATGTDGIQLLLNRSSTNVYTIQLSYYYDGSWKTKNLNGNSGEPANTFAIDSWRHIVAVFDGSNISVFFDGTLSRSFPGQLTESLIGSPNDSDATFTLGASNNGTNTVNKNVYIDSVEIVENLTIDANQAATLFADSTRQTSITDV